MGKYLLILILILFWICQSCNQNTETEKQQKAYGQTMDYIKPIPGKDEIIENALIKRGEVLISYSGCYDCHKAENRSKGPSFQDISKRYPTNQIYIDHLARKIISGGTGAWGYPVMTAHPNIKIEDAQAMAANILSTKNQ
ncbi:c-type cytochrome [Aquiflexum sp.]|uniref:c-type cytochrome n=1 Tax=Aquiflexum sp. TaxID=1872584 RepID=UPI0035937F98